MSFLKRVEIRFFAFPERVHNIKSNRLSLLSMDTSEERFDASDLIQGRLED